jgi:polyisoprenyl-phosphate glycosyltransferase
MIRDRKARPLCSVIVPVCNESANIHILYERIQEAVAGLDADWELLFVDDGSWDDSFDILVELHRMRPEVRALRLSRNFGSHIAIAAGLDHASGDLAIIMAADMQDPPEVLPALFERWKAGCDIVWGVRQDRDDPLTNRLWSWAFYTLIRRIALPDYPKGGTGSFCLIDRMVIEAFQQLRERNRVTFGLLSWVGFRQEHVPYRRERRHAGRSGWTSGRRVKAALDTIASFSYFPIRLISYIGICVSLLSVVGALYVLLTALFFARPVAGWPSLMVVVLFLGGVQLITLGIIGEYLWRSLDESKQRPLYFIRDAVGVKRGRSVNVTVNSHR